jgi:hypothetical protein
MKTLIKLLILVALGVGGYLYFTDSASINDIAKILPTPEKTDPATGKPLIACAPCQGTGLVKCSHTRCKQGKLECTGPCMRLSKGIWVKNASLGKGPDELWQAFPQKGGTQYYSKAHVGEVVEMQDGKAVNIGPCSICAGTTLMPCTTCKGTASITCPTCRGNKEVPNMRAETKTNSPQSANPTRTAPQTVNNSLPPPPPPQTIRLKNGKTIVGNIVIKDPDVVVIRTTDGKTTQIPTSDLATP